MGITVSSASVTRAGFDSMLLVGDETMVDPTATGPSGTGTFDEHMVFRYTTAEQVGPEIVDGHLRDMITIAFAQTPSVSNVYVSYVDTDGSGSGILGSDLVSIALNESNWIGYCSVFEEAADVTAQAAQLLAMGKYYSTLTSSSTTTATYNDYCDVWKTEIPYAEWDQNTSTIGRWCNVAALSSYLSKTQGSYNPAFKGLQSITPAVYTATEEGVLRSSYINQYSPIGGQNVTWDGKNATGKGYIDTFLGAIFLQVRLTEDLMNLMIQTEKLPYTDKGIANVGAVIDSRLRQMTVDGYLDSSRPYQINLPRAAQLTDRASRNLPNVSFIAYTTGAINTIEIQGFIDST